MKIIKELITYPYENYNFEHYILIAEQENKKTLLSYVNIYLKQCCSNSIKTSERYANNLIHFFTYLLRKLPNESRQSIDFWLFATPSHLRSWQGRLVRKRDEANGTKPSDQTIRANAALVRKFYSWAADYNLPVLFKKTSKSEPDKTWYFGFRKESKQRTIIKPVSTDNVLENISINSISRQSHRNLYAMSDNDIQSLMSIYADPVYSVCVILSLATGLREEGICQMPYIGTGPNAHIRPYADMLSELDKNAKMFEFTVTEKGKKRTLQVNLSAWKAICDVYLPLYHERKVKFKAYLKSLPNDKRPTENSVFFLNKAGRPLDPAKIARTTSDQKRKHMPNFPFHFHDCRGWYVTSFLIRHLTSQQIKNHFFDVAVAEALRNQIGHSNFETTYRHYIKVASLVLATKDGKFDYTVADNEFWGILKTSGNS